jgi:hypothetical protein
MFLLVLGDCLQVWYTPAFLAEILIICKSGQNVRLAEGERHIWVILQVVDHKIFDLFRLDKTKRHALPLAYLVAPEQGVSFLSLCTVPYCEQLLDGFGQQRPCLKGIDVMNPPQYPIVSHGPRSSLPLPTPEVYLAL